jgi:phosphoglycolate phosphatase-like HAD superfamily hydrolase
MKRSRFGAIAWGLVVALVGMLVVGTVGAARADDAAKTDAKAEDKSTDETDEKASPEKPDPKKVPTHHQIGVIKVGDEKEPLTINTFCMDKNDRVLAACGGATRRYVRTETGYKTETVTQATSVQIFDLDGKLLDSISVDFKPQAINVDEKGAIYVAGMGQLAKFSPEGKLIAKGDTPNKSDIKKVVEEQKKQIIARNKQYKERMATQIESYEKQVEDLKKKQAELKSAKKDKKANKDGEKADKKADNAQREQLAKQIEMLQSRIKSYKTQAEMMEKRMGDVDAQAEQMAQHKMAITGVAVSGGNVYAASPATAGYGFDVYRADTDFTNPKKIVEGLRGCCGQMDIQAYGGELFVAENSRAQVVRYDRDGKEICKWGKRDREGVVGFGSCCNPMNLRFGPGGEVYTAESNLGRIKRFSRDGEFLGLVGTASIIPGCKHVAIAVSKDGKRVYMLDITRNQINILEEGAAPEKTAQAAK